MSKDGAGDDDSAEAPPASYPLESDEPAATPRNPDIQVADGGSTRGLAWLLQMSPLLDLYDRGNARGSRIREWVCFWGDFAVRAAVVVAIIGILVTVAWKTLAPIPFF